jgi:phosphatidylinositol 4-kinase
VHCNIAFGELVVNFPDTQIAETIDVLMPALVDILDDIPFIDFDKCLSWQGKCRVYVYMKVVSLLTYFWTDWALPDQLVYSTVSALLRLSSSHPEYTRQATTAICSFISQTVEAIKSCEGDHRPGFYKSYLTFLSAFDVLTQLAPALHGLYRAISSTSFTWTITQWEALSTQLNALCSPAIVDRLNHLLLDIFHKEDIDIPTHRFVQTFVSRYVAQERPLSGYFIVCCVIEILWIVLAQVLAPPADTSAGGVTEAAAANKAWLSLMRQAPAPMNVDDQQVEDTLKQTVKYARGNGK